MERLGKTRYNTKTANKSLNLKTTIVNTYTHTYIYIENTACTCIFKHNFVYIFQQIILLFYIIGFTKWNEINLLITKFSASHSKLGGFQYYLDPENVKNT